MALRGFAICGPNHFCDMRICYLWVCDFAGLKLSQVLYAKYLPFLLTKTVYNALIQVCTKQKNHYKNTTFRTVLRQSRAVFCKNFRISFLPTGMPKKFADLR